MSDEKGDFSGEAKFALKHGENSTDRMSADLLNGIKTSIKATGVPYDGRLLSVREVNQPKQDNMGNWYMTVDVLEPDGVHDHVEFTITKTGWGRAI